MSMSSLEWAWNQELGLPYYVVDGRYYYNAVTLNRDPWAVGRDFGYDRQWITPEMRPTSRPVYVRLADFSSVILTTGPDGQLIPLAGPGRTDRPRHVMQVSEMKFPVWDQILPGQAQLPELFLPGFNSEVLVELNRLKNEEGTLRDSPLIQARLSARSNENLDRTLVELLRLQESGEGSSRVTTPSESGRSPLPDNRLEESLKALISRLYRLPLPDLPMISFEEAGRLIQSGEILSYQIDPLFQAWAGPPGTSNRIITLIGRDGTNYLVLAKYLPGPNQILPPSR